MTAAERFGLWALLVIRDGIRGMRLRVKDVLDLPAAGVSEHEILEDYPHRRQDQGTLTHRR